MLDISNIPSSTSSTQIFYTTGTTSWQTWTKPRNAKFIQIFCLGGGGSGGAGGRAVTGSVQAGASGGGSGGIVRAFYPAFLLPDVLYVQPGVGGASVAGTVSTVGGVPGNTGSVSYVSMAPSTTAVYIIAQSSPGSGGNLNIGAANISTTTNTGGSGATVWTFTNSAFTALGIVSASAGVAGPGTPNATTGVTPTYLALATNIVTGGGGGGGNNSVTIGSYTAQNGVSITSASAILLSNVNGGITGSIIGSGNPGDNGYGTLIPFCGTGGAGGSGQASGSGAGGRGGDGWYGCGGGGGGWGSTIGTGGRSGKGGDGIVMITTIF